MAITPPSDILLDVVQAADPAKSKAAAERLARMDWSAVTSEVAASAARPPSPAAAIAVSSSLPSKNNVYSQFEAFVLQSFIEAMLPKQTEVVFGKGMAGEIWKSMLAEKLAAKAAESGGLGIAERVAGTRTHSSAATPSALASPGRDDERADAVPTPNSVPAGGWESRFNRS